MTATRADRSPRFAFVRAKGLRPIEKRGATGLAILLACAWLPSLVSCSLLSEKQELQIKFGVLEVDPSGDRTVRETTEIPLRYRSDGFLYGIEIVTPAAGPPVEVSFVHVLPAPPDVRTGRLENGKVESAGRVIEGTPREAAPGYSTVYPFGFDPGDPTGIYRVIVKIDGMERKEIAYSVTAPQPSTEPR